MKIQKILFILLVFCNTYSMHMDCDDTDMHDALTDYYEDALSDDEMDLDMNYLLHHGCLPIRESLQEALQDDPLFSSRLVNLVKKKPHRSFRAYKGRRHMDTASPLGQDIFQIAVSSDSSLIATAGSKAKLFDAQTGNRLHTFVPLWRKLFKPFGRESEVTSIAFSQDGGMLALGSLGQVKIHDTRTHKCLKKFMFGPQKEETHVAFCPQAKLLAITENSLVHIYDLESNIELKQLYGLWAGSVVFSPDGTYIAFGTRERKAKIYKKIIDQNTRIHSFRYHGKVDFLSTSRVSSISFSPDNQHLACAGLGHIKIVNVESNKQLYTQRVASWPDSIVRYAGSMLMIDTVRKIELLDSKTYDQLYCILRESCFRTTTLDGNTNRIITARKGFLQTYDLRALKKIEQFLTLPDTQDQIELLHAFDDAISDGYWGGPLRRLYFIRKPQRIQATPEQWETFLTLPDDIQRALRLYIKEPQ